MRSTSPAPALVLVVALASGCSTTPTGPASAGSASSGPPRVVRLEAAAVERVAKGYDLGTSGLERRESGKVVEGFTDAWKTNPGDDSAIYYLAAAAARKGDDVDALVWLKRLSELPACLVPSGRTFQKVKEGKAGKEYERLLAIIEKRLPKSQAQVAFTVPEKDLIPEGIAYDGVEGVFYLSSLHKRKIVRVKPGAPGQPAEVTDFTTEKQDGLDSVLGLKVDEKRRRLWVASAAEPFMKGFLPALGGRSALYAFDLTTGKLLKKLWPKVKGPHLFNDLVLMPDGDVYVTDTVSGEIHHASIESDEAEGIVPPGTFAAPNGIAIAPDGKRLLIADGGRGLRLLDPATKRIDLLAQPAGLWPGGLDGIVRHGDSVIGISNLQSRGRVVRFRLEPGSDAISSSDVLECGSANAHFDQPTTGVVVGDDLYFIANSQFGSFDYETGRFPQDGLEDVVILKRSLR